MLLSGAHCLICESGKINERRASLEPRDRGNNRNFDRHNENHAHEPDFVQWKSVEDDTAEDTPEQFQATITALQKAFANWRSSTVAGAVFEFFGADIINVRELAFLNSKIPNFKILNSTIQIPKSEQHEGQEGDGGEAQGIHEGAAVDAAWIRKSLGLPVQQPLPCHWHKVA